MRRLRGLLEQTMSGYEVIPATSRDEGLAAVALKQVDLVVLDLVIPSSRDSQDADARHGEAILEAIRNTAPHIKVIVYSSEGHLVRDFLREKGADDFFTKDQPEAWQQEKLPIQLERFIGHLVCRSPAMATLREATAAVPAAAPLLVLSGPRGSGKEYLSSVLHRCSPRARRPFVALDLASLSAEAVLPELVGTRGASPRPGLLEQHLGCLHITGFERIGDLPADQQLGLAAALGGVGERTIRFRPLEWPEWIEADTRLVLATTAAPD
ncbi:MAG: sigma 54-interacting transcriptional regulator [Armatimonadetes bacterium]|nr:sigma 54-interacting transcriptional regulator [Armatimonadota bacterium]